MKMLSQSIIQEKQDNDHSVLLNYPCMRHTAVLAFKPDPGSMIKLCNNMICVHGEEKGHIDIIEIVQKLLELMTNMESCSA